MTLASALALFGGLVSGVTPASLVGGLVLGFAICPLFGSLVLDSAHNTRQKKKTINSALFNGLVLVTVMAAAIAAVEVVKTKVPATAVVAAAAHASKISRGPNESSGNSGGGKKMCVANNKAGENGAVYNYLLRRQ